MIAALAGLVFALAAFASARLGARLFGDWTRFEDGPAAGRPPTVAFVAAAALVGVSLGMRHASLLELAMGCILCAALVGCSESDIRCGLVPDAFTLVPLALVLAISVAARLEGPVVSALIITTPFAVAAILSKGRGMGWGDVKLVALGGAVLGAELALVAFAAACIGASLVAVLRRRTSEPIAFVPYLAGAAAVAVALPLRVMF